MIVVCGEGLVDLVDDGTLSTLHARLGGGPFNVAVALGRLRVPTMFFSRLSTDGFGDKLLMSLRDCGVDVSAVQRGDEPTTLAMASISGTGAASYTFYLEGTADRFVTKAVDLPPEVRAMSFGTLSLVLEPGASVYVEMLRDAFMRGLTTIVDPNIRPMVIDDPDAYRERFTEIAAHSTIIKSSDEDAEWITGSSPDAAARMWLQGGTLAVVMTRGAEGISVTTRDFTVTVPAAKTLVADTIGAGDTVHGALIAALAKRGCIAPRELAVLSQAQWRGVLEYAAQAAAVTVSRPGADPPWAHELTGD